MRYQETQYGKISTILFLLVIASITVAFIRGTGDHPVTFTGFIILVSIFLIFLLNTYKLKIIVDDGCIHLIFGIGLIHLKLRPEHIREIKPVKLALITGWGFRYTMDGMLYNVQGRQAVRILYGADGRKKMRIGTANPEALIAAIQQEFPMEFPKVQVQ